MAIYGLGPLLAHGVQPFRDKTDAEMEDLVRSIKAHGLLTPLLLSEDGTILINGNQRARALLTMGRKVVTDKDVRLLEGVTAGNALDVAVNSNMQDRQHTLEEKRALAGRLRSERWSQARIARAFGTTQATVSRWLADDPAPEPVSVIGEDGKTYPVAPRTELDLPRFPTNRPPANPWSPGKGKTYRAVQGALRSIKREFIDPRGLSELERVKIQHELTDLITAAEDALTALDTFQEAESQEESDEGYEDE